MANDIAVSTGRVFETWITASASYDVNENVSLFVEGKNLGVPGFDLETKAYLGLADSKVSAYDVANSYVYLGASADVTRAIGTGAKVGLGVNWAYNTDGQAATSGSVAWLKAYANFKF